jgi:hypothetical protein
MSLILPYRRMGYERPPRAVEQLSELVGRQRLVVAERSPVARGQRGATGRMKDDQPTATPGNPGTSAEPRPATADAPPPAWGSRIESAVESDYGRK